MIQAYQTEILDFDWLLGYPSIIPQLMAVLGLNKQYLDVTLYPQRSSTLFCRTKALQKEG